MKTGATKRQIEDVCRRKFLSPRIYDQSAQLPSPSDPSITMHEWWMRQRVYDGNPNCLREEITYWASLLITEADRIISLDDLKRLWDGFNPPIEVFDGNMSDSDAALLDRIDALIAGGDLAIFRAAETRTDQERS